MSKTSVNPEDYPELDSLAKDIEYLDSQLADGFDYLREVLSDDFFTAMLYLPDIIHVVGELKEWAEEKKEKSKRMDELFNDEW